MKTSCLFLKVIFLSRNDWKTYWIEDLTTNLIRSNQQTVSCHNTICITHYRVYHLKFLYSSHNENFQQQHQPIHSGNITYEEKGVNLFQFCPQFPGSSNKELMPESSVCKRPDEAYVLYYNLSTVSRGPRDYLDISLLDIFGKSVPMRNFKKWR